MNIECKRSLARENNYMLNRANWSLFFIIIITAVNKSELNRYCIAIGIILLFDYWCVYELCCKGKQLKVKKQDIWNTIYN